jgi:hypothetical protein
LVSLGDDVSGAVRRANTFDSSESFDHANAAFQAFLAQTPSG